ncbi:hypothetical protein HYV86_06500 [Candidatus Woesearchaeota archaeon]|nr:hypothetical protein [Candidatus Woesearchaeota archaeon]
MDNHAPPVASIKPSSTIFGYFNNEPAVLGVEGISSSTLCDLANTQLEYLKLKSNDASNDAFAPILFSNYQQIAALEMVFFRLGSLAQGLRVATPHEVWQYLQDQQGQVPLRGNYQATQVPIGLVLTKGTTENYFPQQSSDVLAWGFHLRQQGQTVFKELDPTYARASSIPSYPTALVSAQQSLERLLSFNPIAGNYERHTNNPPRKQFHGFGNFGVGNRPTYTPTPIRTGVFVYSVMRKNDADPLERSFGPTNGYTITNGLVLLARDMQK